MRRQHRVQMSLEPAVQQVPPGCRVRFRLHVANPAPQERRVVLRLRDAPGDWRTLLPVRDLRVPARSAVTLFLRVDAPATARWGERETFQVLASALDELERPARLDVEVIVATASGSSSTVSPPSPAFEGLESAL